MGLLKKIKKSRLISPVRRYLGYLLVRTAAGIVGRLSWKTIVRFGRRLGKSVFTLIPCGRKRTLDNLEMVFGEEKSKNEIRKIARGVYENTAVTALEFFKTPRFGDREFLEKVIYTPDQVKLLEDLLGEGNGSIYASAHLGNWEMLAGFGARLGLPMSVLYKPTTNPYINGFLLKMRSANRLININTDLSVVIKRLRANECVSLLFDENARGRGIRLPFFGREVSTYRGPAYFSLRARAPVVCIYFIREEDGRQRFIIDRILRPKRKGKLEDDIRKMMEEMNASLEKTIRRYPDQWNWMYKRWSDI